MPRYNPKAAGDCLPEGTYDATISGVVEKESKSGKPMLVLELTVYGDGGRRKKVTDYISLNDGIWRLKQLAKAVGDMAGFDTGELDWAFGLVDTNIRVDLKIEDGKGDYDDQNRVKKYHPATGEPKAAAPAKSRAAIAPSTTKDPYEPVSEDEIPF